MGPIAYPIHVILTPSIVSSYYAIYPPFRVELLKLSHAYEALGSAKTDSDSVCLGWSLEVSISKQRLGDASAAILCT